MTPYLLITISLALLVACWHAAELYTRRSRCRADDWIALAVATGVFVWGLFLIL